MIRIKVQNKQTDEIVWFACFDSNHRDLFIFQRHKLESQFEHGLVHDYQPIGISWDEMRIYEKG